MLSDKVLDEVYKNLYDATGGSSTIHGRGKKAYVDYKDWLRYYHAVCKSLDKLEKWRNER